MPIKIGVIDSGWGGVLFTKYLSSAFPQVEFIVALDQKYFPYGQKSLVEVESRAIASTKFLEDQGVLGVVIACNTASIVLERLQQKFSNLFFIDMISPAVSLVLKTYFLQKRLLVLMTECTKNSNIYKEKLSGVESEGVFIEYRACPQLVTLAEKGGKSEEEISKIVQKSINGVSVNFSHILLACTHFYEFKQTLQGDTIFLDVPAAIMEEVSKKIPQISVDSVGICRLYTNRYEKNFVSRIRDKLYKEVQVEELHW